MQAAKGSSDRSFRMENCQLWTDPRVISAWIHHFFPDIDLGSKKRSFLRLLHDSKIDSFLQLGKCNG
jgi:hypothetical protein